MGDHLICQFELFPVVLVRWEFQSELANKRVLLFVDNNSARGAILKGRSSSPTMDDLVKAFYAAEVLSPAFWWEERFPVKVIQQTSHLGPWVRKQPTCGTRCLKIIFLARNQWSHGSPRRHPTEHSVSQSKNGNRTT